MSKIKYLLGDVHMIVSRLAETIKVFDANGKLLLKSKCLAYGVNG